MLRSSLSLDRQIVLLQVDMSDEGTPAYEESLGASTSDFLICPLAKCTREKSYSYCYLACKTASSRKTNNP